MLLLQQDVPWIMLMIIEIKSRVEILSHAGLGAESSLKLWKSIEV